MTKEEAAAKIQANPGRNNLAWPEVFSLYNKENPQKPRLKLGCGGCYDTAKRWLGIK